MSDKLRVPRKSVMAFLIAPPVMPSVSICCLTQAPTFSKTPELSSAWVISPPPGKNSIRARMMFAALASTGLMLIGFIPRMIVNIRKPGIMFAWSAK